MIGLGATLASVGDTVDAERDEEKDKSEVDDDGDAEGDTELADFSALAAAPASLMTVQRLENTRPG